MDRRLAGERGPYPDPGGSALIGRSAGAMELDTRVESTRADASWRAFVAILYAAATALAAWYYQPAPDRMMILAGQIVGGRLDSASFAGTVDTVEIAGRFYLAVGPLQVLPYLPFVWLPALQPLAGHLICAVLGIAAAWLALPLLRMYGTSPATARRLATFVALGTLLFYVSVFGDLYYLAHVEAFLALELMLLEWARARRPVVLGVLV